MMGCVMFRIWRLHWVWAVPVYAILGLFDLGLFAASSTKIPDGAWLPLVIAALTMLVFTTWSRGLELLSAAIRLKGVPLDGFLRDNAGVARVPGFAVYLSRDADAVPTALLQSLKHTHVLQEHVLLVTIQTALRPRRSRESRLRFTAIAPGIARAALIFGFLDEPNVPAALTMLPPEWHAEPSETSYILGRQNAIPAAKSGMARWRVVLFSTMLRLSGSAAGAYFRLPADRVVELGNVVEI
jgi:KUP system potassium uptake protein